MKKPTYANLNRQFLERNKQANQYHDNWIKEIAEVNKLKLKLSEAHNDLKKLFVRNEALKSSLKSLLECV